jgi:hypothetical protein
MGIAPYGSIELGEKNLLVRNYLIDNIYYLNGLINLTPVPVMSSMFLLTTVKPLVSAVAAICLSRAFS